MGGIHAGVRRQHRMEGRPTEQKMIWKDGIHSNRTATADGRATGRTDDNTEGRKEGIDAGERLGESPILDGRAAAGGTEDDMEGRSGRSQPLQLIPHDHEFNPQQKKKRKNRKSGREDSASREWEIKA